MGFFKEENTSLEKNSKNIIKRLRMKK